MIRSLCLVVLLWGIVGCASDPIMALNADQQDDFRIYLLTNRLDEIDRELRQVNRTRDRIVQQSEVAKLEGNILKSMRLLSRSIDLFERAAKLGYERDLILEGDERKIANYYTE